MEVSFKDREMKCHKGKLRALHSRSQRGGWIFPTPPSDALWHQLGPTNQLHSDTIYPQRASGSAGKGLRPQAQVQVVTCASAWLQVGGSNNPLQLKNKHCSSFPWLIESETPSTASWLLPTLEPRPPPQAMVPQPLCPFSVLHTHHVPFPSSDTLLPASCLIFSAWASFPLRTFVTSLSGLHPHPVFSLSGVCLFAADTVLSPVGLTWSIPKKALYSHHQA